MVAAGGLRYRMPLGCGRPAMDEARTLAIDIGGTGIKLAVLDGAGRIIGKRVRLPTPSPPVGPEAVTAAIGIASARLGGFDRAAVGFPGVVRGGRIVNLPIIRCAATRPMTSMSAGWRWKKPARRSGTSGWRGSSTSCAGW